MTHFSDDLFLGPVKSTPTVSNPANGGIGYGPLGRAYFYNIVPLTLQSNNYATTQTPLTAGNLTLTAGAGITLGTDRAGHVSYTADVPRSVSISCGSNDTARTFTVSGYDYLGQPQTEAIAGNSGSITNGKKAFISIWQIAVDAATAGTVTAGTSDVFGLPVNVVDGGYIVSAGWASALPNDAGTFVAADATIPATASTGDVRGTYKPSSSSNGARRLVVGLHVTGLQIGPNATFVGLFGVVPA